MIEPGSRVRGVLAVIWCLLVGSVFIMTQAGAVTGYDLVTGPFARRLEWVYGGFVVLIGLLIAADYRRCPVVTKTLKEFDLDAAPDAAGS